MIAIIDQRDENPNQVSEKNQVDNWDEKERIQKSYKGQQMAKSKKWICV